MNRDVWMDVEPMTLPDDALIMTEEDGKKILDEIVKGMGVPAHLMVVVDSYSTPVAQ